MHIFSRIKLTIYKQLIRNNCDLSRFVVICKVRVKKIQIEVQQRHDEQTATVVKE